MTPAKARNLLFQHQLRTMSEDDVASSVIVAVTAARFSVEGARLGFGVESPLVRSAIQAKSKSKGVFPDISISGEILYVTMAQIGDFITAFIPQARRDRLIEGLRKKKVVSPDELTRVLNRVGEVMAKEAAKAGGKAAASTLGHIFMDWVRETIAGSDVNVPDLIGDLL